MDCVDLKSETRSLFVIASAAKQSSACASGPWNCFVANAPHNDAANTSWLGMTAEKYQAFDFNRDVRTTRIKISVARDLRKNCTA
jgi:hypothetical protein